MEQRERGKSETSLFPVNVLFNYSNNNRHHRSNNNHHNDKNNNDINLDVSTEGISEIKCIDTLLQIDVDIEENSFEVENTYRVAPNSLFF